MQMGACHVSGALLLLDEIPVPMVLSVLGDPPNAYLKILWGEIGKVGISNDEYFTDESNLDSGW